MKKSLLILGCMLATGWSAAQAQTPSAAPGLCPANGTQEQNGWDQPDAQTAVTQHHFSAGGQSFDYTARAGTLVIHDDEHRPVAGIGYTAYFRAPVKGAPRRPVLFAFNGGPGSSSVWLHIGMLGPRRVLANDAGPTSVSSLKMVDNPYGMLDKVDVVMIDPVGTGIGRAICGKKDSDFWSTDADAESVGKFITQFLGANDLWAAPKYILGESYGTVRASIVVNYLRTQRVSFNGVILLGTAIDMEAIYTDIPGNDRPYPLFVPGFAATAWYHKLIPESERPLEPFLEEARRFSLGPYATALLKGNALPDEERDAVAERMHHFTGLSTAYIKASNLRVSEFAYGQELMRSQGKIVSRLDSRFTGETQDPTQKSADYDPILSYLGSAYAAAFNDYYRHDLKVNTDRSYKILNSEAGYKFTMGHKPLGVVGDPQPIVNAGVDLATAMIQDPNVHVLVLAGYFDLGSTFSAAEYMISHLRIPKTVQSRISMKYYRSGHMIYAHEPSLRQMKSDLDQFIDASR